MCIFAVDKQMFTLIYIYSHSNIYIYSVHWYSSTVQTYFHNEYIYKLITNSRQRNKTKNTIVKRRDRHTRTLLSVALPSRMTPLLTVIVCTSIVFVYITLYQDYAVRGCTRSRGTSSLHPPLYNHSYIYTYMYIHEDQNVFTVDIYM